MPKQEVHTEVEGQKLKLTNLDKILYPKANISKAEVISYYLEVAPFMMPHLIGRPLTLIRFPDGIGKKTFYTKNKPSWTPDWMPSSVLPWDEDNTYLIANTAAHLAWLANLAALEIHTMNSTMSSIENPKQFVIDLDPPENWSFDQVKDIAQKMNLFLADHGYHAFGKLSGGKGIHLVVPIAPNWPYKEVVDCVKGMMKAFIRIHKNTTLHVHKERRKDKMLLDVLRNHAGNTTVAPYSLRGKEGGPVSMPLKWEEIMGCSSPQQYTLQKAIDYLKENGDAWADYASKASLLHTSKEIVPVNKKLNSYTEKRDFSKTDEPNAIAKAGDTPDASVNGKFVIHLHDATNLHYDLRLGQDGVLKSWAIPKGLPIRENVKRLAIQTEDHPAKYIDFEGAIPKAEYGGGEMWIFDTGVIKWTKQTKKHLKFTLEGEYLNAKYNLYKIKEREWIVELDQSNIDQVMLKGLKPMLADVSKGIPKNASDYLFEIKWDGIRVMIYKDGDQLKIVSRSGRDITDKFPEFQDIKFCNVQHAVFDAELVCLDEQGRPLFADIISRMHRIGNIKAAVKSKPVYMYLFDCLYIDGKQITSLPFTARRELMRPILKLGNLVRESEIFEDGQQIFDAAKAMNLEGIMAKRKNGKYAVNARSDAWRKIKFRQTIECTIIGYTKGQGDRASLFGALHLAQLEGTQWKYFGKVGTGFDHKKMTAIFDQLKLVEKIKKPIQEKVDDEKNSTWIVPLFACEVQYASMTNNDTLREPVFMKMWPLE